MTISKWIREGRFTIRKFAIEGGQTFEMIEVEVVRKAGEKLPGRYQRDDKGSYNYVRPKPARGSESIDEHQRRFC